MNRGQLPARLLPTHPTRGDGPERLSGRITICRNTPSHIMSPTRSQPGPSAEVSLGVRGHTPAPQRAHAPPSRRRSTGIHAGGRPLTHTNHHPAEALDNQTTGQVSSSFADARKSVGDISCFVNGEVSASLSRAAIARPAFGRTAGATQVLGRSCFSDTRVPRNSGLIAVFT